MERIRIGLLLLIATVLPAAAEEPGERLAAQGRLIEARAAANLPASPDDARWREVPAARLTLYPQAAIAPGLPDGAPREVDFRILVADDRWVVRLDWADATESRYRRDETAAFADAAAVQFGAFGGPARLPYLGMGEPGRPVGIWYWRAGSEGAQLLAAEGFGTLRPSPGPAPGAIEARGERQWRLLLSGAPPLDAGGLTPIAVAVWDGAVDGRAGRKWLSSWLLLRVPGRSEDPALWRALLDESETKGDATRGAALAEELGCNGCHTLPKGERAEAGPDLTFAGGQHWPGYLRRAIAEPSAFIVPQPHFATEQDGRKASLMPSFELGETQREDLVAFLASLR